VTSTEKILRGIKRGGALDELATELGMRKSLLMATIAFMVRAGYHSEIRSGKGQGCGCGRCPMSKTCSVPAQGSRKVRMYMLTEKGMECVKAAKNDGVINWERN